MVAEYYRNDIELLFTVMLLVITLWVGHCLWEDPDKNVGAPDDPCAPAAPQANATEAQPAATRPPKA